MIEIRNCVKDYSDNRAVDDITVTIPEGCSYGLLGSNAAGKSTLLKMMTGIYRPTAGTITIDGEPVYDNAGIKERLFFVDDETVQYSNMTLGQMRKYYKRFYPAFDEKLFEKLRETVGLPEDKKMHKFSKGMKRQAVVICGVACRTKYLFIDEAFDGLDQMMRTIIKNILIDEILDNKLTVVFSSHNLSEIDEFCDRVGLLHNGKMLLDRELDSVKSDIVKVRAAFDREITADDLPELDVKYISTSGSLTDIIAAGGAEKVRAAVEKLSPKLCDLTKLSLKEIFIYEMEGVGYDGSKLEE